MCLRMSPLHYLLLYNNTAWLGCSAVYGTESAPLQSATLYHMGKKRGGKKKMFKNKQISTKIEGISDAAVDDGVSNATCHLFLNKVPVEKKQAEKHIYNLATINYLTLSNAMFPKTVKTVMVKLL